MLDDLGLHHKKIFENEHNRPNNLHIILKENFVLDKKLAHCDEPIF
jgi:hypothetical protein